MLFFDIIEWTCLKSSSVVYQYLPLNIFFLSMSKDNAVNDVHHLGRNIAFNLTFKAMVKTQSIILHSCIFHVTSLPYTLIYSLILECFRYVQYRIWYHANNQYTKLLFMNRITLLLSISWVIFIWFLKTKQGVSIYFIYAVHFDVITV